MPERELPGRPFQGTGEQPYGLDRHLQEYGNGTSLLRTDRLSQPRALKPGDILATGDQILSEPREGGNGSVLIHLTGGLDGHWIDVPARLPIALLTEQDQAPTALWEYHEEHKPRSSD